MNDVSEALLLLALTAFSHFLPVWTRADLFFAITVQPEFRRTAAARSILRQYRLMLWIFAIPSIGLELATGLLIPAVLLQFVGFAIALTSARRQTKEHAAAPSPILEVDLAPPPETMPGGWFVALLPVASLFVLGYWAMRHWDRLPARFPIHWGLNGPNRWLERTTAGLYGFLAIHATVALGLAIFAWGILNWSRRGWTGPPAEGERQFRKLNVQLLLVVNYLIAIQAWLSLVDPSAIGLWWGLAIALVIVSYLVRLIRIQRRARLGAAQGDRTPDSCWKWGIVYVNPSNPAIFVAQRFGVGFTLNLGNRWSWAILLLLLSGIFVRSALRGG